jgi:hypothetical protein
MKPTEILTAIVAIYGATLSTINLAIAIRAKRRRVAVTYSIGFQEGKDLILYRAINLGERDVALKRFYVGIAKKTLFGWINNQMFFSEEFVVKCEPTLPLKLDPGRVCEMIIDQGQLLNELSSMNLVRGVNRVLGVFEDETGGLYKSPVTRVEWPNRAIVFP